MPDSGIHTPVTDLTTTPRDPAQRRWSLPSITELPKLTALTLASSIGGGGGTGGGGSTVFGLFLALGVALGTGACHTDREMGPGSDPPRTATQTITCRASVAEETIDCAGPQGAAPLIIGGQGMFVELRSRRARYRSALQLFDFEVRIENLSSQAIGTTGGVATGIKVFFVSGPTVTAGVGAATVNNADGTDNFTAPGQPYFLYPDSLATTKVSIVKDWEISMPATVTSFVFTVLVSADVPDPNDILLWMPVVQFNTHDLTGIAANSATDAMAVGINGRNIRKTSRGWETISTEFEEDWLGVQAMGSGKYIGATKQGTVGWFDGKAWQPVYDAGFQVTAFGGSSTKKLAIGGNDRVAWTADDTTWVVYNNGALGVVTGIIPFHADSFIAVTATGRQVLVNYNDDASTVSVTATGLKYLNAYGRPGTVYGAGTYDGGPDIGGVVNRTGAVGYQATDTIPDAIEVGSGGTLWLAARSVATGHTTLLSNPGFSPGGWISRGTIDTTVTDLKSDAAGGFYLVDPDGILRWNGTSIVHELFQTDEHIPTALAATGLRVMVGTDAGLVQYGTVDGWVTLDPDLTVTDSITAAGLFSTNGAWVVDDDGRVYEWNGTAWSPVTVLADRIGDLFVWDHDHAVLVGQDGPGGIVEREVNGAWSRATNPGGGTDVPFEAVWGTSVDEFWAVGGLGKVVHYSGGLYTLNALPTPTNLHAVTGWSASDVWVAGDGGYIAHWNGSAWTECFLGTATIRDLWSPTPGTVFAAADVDGAALTAPACMAKRMRITGSGGIHLVAGDAVDRIWALKTDDVIYRGHE